VAPLLVAPEHGSGDRSALSGPTTTIPESSGAPDAVPVSDRPPRGVDPARVARDLGPQMMSLARHHGAGMEAEDVWQRALEMVVRRAESLDPEWIERWLHVVVRHEARLRTRRLPMLALQDEVHGLADRRSAREDERLEIIDLRERARRYLPRLKPQERRALGLLAAGLSYREIGEQTGWSRTKVNRCVSEGRAALRRMGAAVA